MKLTHGSLFAGIGGFDLGFERAGIETKWQVEIDERCREHLARRFPDATQYGDIRWIGTLPWVDIISGGFPCQPFSPAGRRQARDDDRYLWPEMFRIVCAVRPQIVVAENTLGLAHEFDWILEDILADLEGEGYETLPPLMVPACAFGAWHRRDRVWILANVNEGSRSAEQKQQQEKRAKVLRRNAEIYADAYPARREDISGSAALREGNGNGAAVCGDWWDAEPGVGRVVHGVPSRLDRRTQKWRVEHLGESVVPQIAEWIGHRIVAVHAGTNF